MLQLISDMLVGRYSREVKETRDTYVDASFGPLYEYCAEYISIQHDGRVDLTIEETGQWNRDSSPHRIVKKGSWYLDEASDGCQVRVHLSVQVDGCPTSEEATPIDESMVFELDVSNNLKGWARL